jgi:hypothetical protein
MTAKGKLIAVFLLVMMAAGSGFVSFKAYDFTEHNPQFCVSCHLMQPAFDAWTTSSHSEINCHDCHYLTIVDKNKLLLNFVLYRPDEVPERHGEIIVPWKKCVRCHWDEDEAYPEAKKINDSQIHAKHYFMQQIECSKCHGYLTHRFRPEARFCVQCHTGKEVHGAGMEQLACLNCHTDRTRDLRPDRAKCLFCHGNGEERQEMLAEGTLDTRNHKVPDDILKRAIKIKLTEGAPMHFDCNTCHHPHAKVRPDWKNCFQCHQNIPITGAHQMHVGTMGLDCNTCHKPHIWRVTEAQAKTDCVLCHEYRDPKKFLM